MFNKLKNKPPKEGTKEADEKWVKEKLKKLKVEKHTTGETFGADEALMKKIAKKFKGVKTKKMKQHYTIVFCPITSRVGSDVEAVLETVKKDQNIILVLMHHTRDADYSTAGIDWSETTNNVCLDVHVLFHETFAGLLSCPQNEKAINEIEKFLRKSSQGNDKTKRKKKIKQKKPKSNQTKS